MNVLNSAEIYARLLPLLHQSTSRPLDAPVSPDDRLEQDLGLDSIGFLTLGLYLEETFGLDIGADVEAYGQVITVADMVDFVAQRI